MIGAPNSLDLTCKVCVMKETPGPSVSEEIADIFTNYNIDIKAWIQSSFLDRYKIPLNIYMQLEHRYMRPYPIDALVFLINSTRPSLNGGEMHTIEPKSAGAHRRAGCTHNRARMFCQQTVFTNCTYPPPHHGVRLQKLPCPKWRN